jgi:glycosyltransferase involved in cell wall biosynthesis
MNVTVLNKAVIRFQRQGLFGVLCVSLIKLGIYLQRLGNRLEQRYLKVKIDKGQTPVEEVVYRTFPGILNLIQQSYAQVEFDRIEAVDSNQSEGREVSWIIPHFSRGSGGHMTLFRFVGGLEKLGIRCRIYLLNDMHISLNPSKIKQQICEYFCPIEGDVEIITPEDMQRSVDVLICTSWQTVYAGRTFHAKRKIYFMQDYEPYFSPVGTYYFLAEQTYRMGFEYFTAGPWLLELVKNRFGGQGDFFYLCPDKDVYYPRQTFQHPQIRKHMARAKSSVFKIGLYNRAHTPRRCVEIAWVALSLLAQKGYDFTVFTFGDDEKRIMPFHHIEMGILNHNDLAEVYSYCDIVVAPSGTNLSLLAREVMACGGIVLDLEGDNTARELKNMENALLGQPTVDSLLHVLEQAIQFPERLHALRKDIEKQSEHLPEWSDQVMKMGQFLALVPRSPT